MSRTRVGPGRLPPKPATLVAVRSDRLQLPPLQAPRHARTRLPLKLSSKHRLTLALLVTLFAASITGCANVLGAFAYFLSPPHIEKAEFRPGKGKFAILIEDIRPTDDHPVFRVEFFDKLVELFRERKVSTNVIPLDELTELRKSNPEYDSWSVQKIGRELKAEQVLYVRVERFDVRETPDHPLLKPAVKLKLKVIDTAAPPEHARLWPKDVEWRELECTRQSEEATTGEQADTVSAKLARDTAQLAVRFFYDVDLEERVHKER